MNFETMMLLAYGATFGILVMSIVYTFIRYLYSKEIIYISYSVMQVFSLLYIASYSTLFNRISHLQDYFLIPAILSAIVFAIAFYEGKYTPKITNGKELIIYTLLLYLAIVTIFYHYVLFEYLPYTVVYAILLISVVLNFKKGLNPTVVYVVGWSLLCVLFYLFDFKTSFVAEHTIDIFLIAFSVEAILFTTSVSYKYRLLKRSAEDFQNMLLQQVKLAKSGEMIGNITHQFRQPLNNISYILINLKKRRESGNLDDAYFEKKLQTAQDQLQFLSKTIDDFKEFYTPSKRQEDFQVKDAIEKSLTVLSADLKSRDIAFELIFRTNENIKVYGIKNELSQVLFSILLNAFEALEDKDAPHISISVEASSAEVTIVIEDNAGGIKKKDMEMIFEPYFSTKESGTGIGLYLAKLIVEESLDGKIAVENGKEGARFTLSLEKSI